MSFSKNPHTTLDKVFLHPFWGLPLFFLVMYGLFLFTVGFGGIFQDAFDLLGQLCFIKTPQYVMEATSGPHWLSLLLLGLGQGLCTVLSFIPLLMSLFVGLGLLEQSGYLLRAARVADRLIRWIGLPGKALIPLLIGFGCNVPAVLETRMLSNARDRILTIMMLPFMSCGARLAIYAVFVSIFFKGAGFSVIFALYLIGILVAVLTALLFRWALWQKSSVLRLGSEFSSISDIALPSYKPLNLKCIAQQAWSQVRNFIRKAGILIVPSCMILSCLGIFQPQWQHDAEQLGRRVNPFFEPMGIQADNWPATIGLLGGLAAKEVLLVSLTALYAQEGPVLEAENLISPETPAESSLKEMWAGTIQEAGWSLVQNTQLLLKRSLNPFYSLSFEHKLNPQAQRNLQGHFGSPAAAFAYLLFILLYFPCISVVAVIKKELNAYWAGLSILWSSALAYLISVIFYQGYLWIKEGVTEAQVWVFSMLGLWISLVLAIRWLVRHCTAFRPTCALGGLKPISIRVI